MEGSKSYMLRKDKTIYSLDHCRHLDVVSTTEIIHVREDSSFLAHRYAAAPHLKLEITALKATVPSSEWRKDLKRSKSLRYIRVTYMVQSLKTLKL